MSRFADKVAVVTGASKGIGAGIAKRLAAEGATVIPYRATSQAEADGVSARITQVADQASWLTGESPVASRGNGM